ncbi:MAG TPA: MFS transporter, partial [Burkholderiales bacterium]|nr:MFS transporter [Burkholderiales bacterium]
AAARTGSLLASGSDAIAALNGGYHLAFLIGAMFAATAAVLGAVFLRAGQQAQGHSENAGSQPARDPATARSH